MDNPQPEIVPYVRRRTIQDTETKTMVKKLPENTMYID